MEIYFDNAATTRADDCVVDLMAKVMREDYGNPSSRHMKGVDAEKYLKEARKTLSGILKTQEKEIIFTSGGTESNNMALIGTALSSWRKGKHIITTCFEHPSVLEPLKYLEQYICPDGNSFEIQYLPVDENGHADLDELARSIRPDTILVSVMFVNNEIGAVQDISRIGRIVKEMNPDCVFHVDAVQAFGKYSILPRRMNIDLMSASGHKFHGPKGIGFLYKNEHARIKPLILGGGQQQGMRSGTDPVPQIAGLARAAGNAYLELDSNVSYLISLKDRMISGLEDFSQMLAHTKGESSDTGRKKDQKSGSESRYIKVHSRKGSLGAPHIVSATFFPVKSEVMLHALEDRGIFVSSGSACSSNKPGLSGTLQAIGLSAREADCTLRFSFSKYNSEEEVDYALKAIREVYGILCRFTSY